MIYPSSLFTYHKATKTFATEMSDLQMYGPRPMIAMQSVKTQLVVYFVYDGKLQDDEQFDGELTGYKYDTEVNGIIYKLHLYND